MKKKVLLMTAISLLLLGAVLAAALNAVFTVTEVKVLYSALSEEGTADSYALQARLEELYLGSSTTFLDLEEVKETVKEFPAFRVDEVGKDFPRTLVLTLSEKEEVFSFRREDGSFAVLDEEGGYLYDKADNSNRCNGENLLLEGFSLSTGGVGDPAEGDYFEELITFFREWKTELKNVRANVRSVSLIPTENPMQGDYFFRIRMTEGVVADVYNPSNLTKDKALAVLATYRSLTDAQKMYGSFNVYDLVTGGFTVSRHEASLPY